MSDMPCTCPDCGEIVELNDMVRTVGTLSLHALVCPDCYENLESDDE